MEEGRRPSHKNEVIETRPGGFALVTSEGAESLGLVSIRPKLTSGCCGNSPAGRNFLSIMKQRAETGDTVRVVADQTGCPTSAIDLANAVLSLANHIATGSTARGTYHFCGPNIMTWHAFARAIFRQVAGEAACRRVLPISSDEFGDDVPRPAYSALDCQAIKRDFGIEAPAMEASMTRDLGKIDALSSG